MPDPWLYVTDSKFSGVGIDLVSEQQLRAFSEHRTAVHLVSRACLDLPGVRNSSHRFPPTKLFSWLPSQSYYALNKRYFSYLGSRYLGRGDYAGVVAWSKTALRLFEAAERHGLPRLLNVGNSHTDFIGNTAAVVAGKSRWPRISREQYRAEYELATCILVPSEHTAHTFVSQGVAPEKIRVIYRGADTARFSPLADKPAKPFIVASCGRLGRRKGTYDLLKIWRRLNLSDAELWLIGQVPSDDAEALRELATPSVRFLGFRPDVPELLRQAHLHVLLSSEEGFAKVLLEAGASGVANLCTREAGFAPNAPGTIFIDDRENEDAVATVIKDLYRNPDLCAQLGREACHTVQLHYGWDAFRRRFFQVVDAVGTP